MTSPTKSSICIVLIAAIAVLVGARNVAAQDQMIPASAVAGTETVPVDGDIFRFRAVLAETDEGGDLYIYTDAGEGWKLAVEADNIVWRGGMYGQEPWLEATEHGSLKLYSENSAIGRNRWEQILTIAYRGGAFVVAGFTYSYYDTLDPDAGGICDVNLLTGKGEHKGKPFKTSFNALPVQEWTMDTRPPECVED